MEPPSPFKDLNLGLNLVPQLPQHPRAASVDFLPENKMPDLHRRVQAFVQAPKASKKTSGQRSSSAAMLDSSLESLDMKPPNGRQALYQCFCGNQQAYEKNYLRHIRAPCRMHELCTRI